MNQEGRVTAIQYHEGLSPAFTPVLFHAWYEGQYQRDSLKWYQGSNDNQS